MIELTCKECERSFGVFPYEAKRRKCCSKECADKAQIKSFEVTCQECEKVFTACPSRKQKFCSKACYNIARESKIELICKECGKAYQSKNKRSKYCSQKCVGKNKRKRIQLECFVCNKTFERAEGYCRQRKDLAKICCSEECKEIRYKAWVKVKICRNCEKEYRPMSNWKNQDFCSRKCFNEFKSKGNIFKKCLTCDAFFKVTPSKKKFHPSKFCSRKCHLLFLKNNKEAHPRWRGVTKEKICPECKKEFRPKALPLSDATKHCSLKCARQSIEWKIKVFKSRYNIPESNRTELDEQIVKTRVLLFNLKRKENQNVSREKPV